MRDATPRAYRAGLRRIAAVAVVASLLAGAGARGEPTRVHAGCPGGARLGRLAYIRANRIHILDLGSCRDRVLPTRLAIGGGGELRWSPSGASLDVGTGRVRASDGRFLGPALQWSRNGDFFARITAAGGLVAGASGHPGRAVLPARWGVTTVAFSPTGKGLAVGRSTYTGPSSTRAANWHQEIWIVDARSGRHRRVYRLRRGLAPPWVEGWSPDGSYVLFWSDTQNSASLAADGLPFSAVRVRDGRVAPIGHVLTTATFATWCGRRLVFASGSSRETTRGSALLSTAPPSWRTRKVTRDGNRSWISPSCSPSGTQLAASAGPNRFEQRFGRENRSLWLLSADGSRRARLTSPPRNATDESPQWSADGRWLFFVRAQRTAKDAGAAGGIYLLDVTRKIRYGPLGRVDGGNYYGLYSWQLAWFQPS